MRSIRRLGTLTIIGLLLTQLHTCPASAQDEATELSKKTQNPVSDLISVPFQSNFEWGGGPRRLRGVPRIGISSANGILPNGPDHHGATGVDPMPVTLTGSSPK